MRPHGLSSRVPSCVRSQDVTGTPCLILILRTTRYLHDAGNHLLAVTHQVIAIKPAGCDGHDSVWMIKRWSRHRAGTSSSSESESNKGVPGDNPDCQTGHARREPMRPHKRLNIYVSVGSWLGCAVGKTVFRLSPVGRVKTSPEISLILGPAGGELTFAHKRTSL